MPTKRETLLQTLHDLTCDALSEKRDLETHELQAVADGLKQASDLKKVEARRAKDAAEAAGINQWMHEKGLDGLEDEYSAGTGDPNAKAGRGPWGAVAVKTLTQRAMAVGSKQLLTPSGAVGVPSLSATLPAVGERLETILQAIPTTRDGNGLQEYLREVTRTHAAAAVAAGAEKPESEYELEEVVAIARVIAH